MRGLLLEPGLEQQRRRQRQPAEADIGDVSSSIELDAEQHVAARGNSVVGLAPQHPRGKAAGLEAKRLQRMQENQIVLVAITAAAAREDLVLQRGEIELYRSAQERVEIFERDRLRVLPMQCRQRLQRRICPATVADAGEIGVDVEGSVGHGKKSG